MHLLVLISRTRYVNVDYVYFAAVFSVLVQVIVVSYDIACQWSRNFRKRVENYQGCITYNKDTTFLVPKFHLPAHQQSCKDNYSFNYTKGVGQTDGEAPERGWAITNVFGPMTKEMGPGARHDLLDDVFGDQNWRKVARLRKC